MLIQNKTDEDDDRVYGRLGSKRVVLKRKTQQKKS